MEFHNLGWVELHRGNIDAAARMFAELSDLGVALDPDDQSELDWLTRELAP